MSTFTTTSSAATCFATEDCDQHWSFHWIQVPAPQFQQYCADFTTKVKAHGKSVFTGGAVLAFTGKLQGLVVNGVFSSDAAFGERAILAFREQRFLSAYMDPNGAVSCLRHESWRSGSDAVGVMEAHDRPGILIGWRGELVFQTQRFRTAASEMKALIRLKAGSEALLGFYGVSLCATFPSDFELNSDSREPELFDNLVDAYAASATTPPSLEHSNCICGVVVDVPSQEEQQQLLPTTQRFALLMPPFLGRGLGSLGVRRAAEVALKAKIAAENARSPTGSVTAQVPPSSEGAPTAASATSVAAASSSSSTLLPSSPNEPPACPLDMEPYNTTSRRPVVLQPCGHGMCEKCFTLACAMTKDLLCPFCRTPLMRPASAGGTPMINWALMELLAQ